MVLVHADGNLTSTATEANLFAITANLKHYATWIFTHNMASGDTLQIRVYVRDENAPAERKYIDTTLSDAQTVPAFFIPFVPSLEYRVSIQRTAGTDRNYTWVRAEA